MYVGIGIELYIAEHRNKTENAHIYAIYMIYVYTLYNAC